MATIVVTGATGFIGSHLVEALVAQNHEVRCLVRPRSNRRWLPADRLVLCPASLESGEGLAEALAGAEVVFHLAGATKARTPEEFHQANVEGFRRLLDLLPAQTPGLKRLVLLSSQAAAGPAAQGIMDETGECRPMTYYGQSKLAAEKLLAERPELPAVVLRAVSVYGPRDRDFLTLVKSIRSGIAPILGERNKQLTFVHVQDVVQALVLAADAPRAVGQTYFVSDGRVYSWEETRSTIENVLGCRKAWEIRLPWPLLWLAAAISDLGSRITGRASIINLNRMKEFRQANWACSSARLQSDLNYRPQFDLAAGLRHTLDWAQAHGWL